MKDLITLTAESFKIKSAGVYEYNGTMFEITEAAGGKYSGECNGKRFNRWDIAGVKSLVGAPHVSRKRKVTADLSDIAEDAAIIPEEPTTDTDKDIAPVKEEQPTDGRKSTKSGTKKEAAEDAAKIAAEEAKKAEAAAKAAADAMKAAEAAMRKAEEAKRAAEIEAAEEAKRAAEEKGQQRHPDFNKVLELVRMDIPLYLYGPAGTGKNVICQQIAEELGLNFYFSNSVTQEYKIVGFVDAGGRFHETEFYRAFKHGGLFMLDEIDASIPEVLTLLNAAIANRYLVFGNNERVQAHDNFRIVAAGNTAGTGATEEYCGRVQLDAASLNRFAVMELNYAPNIEEKVAGNNNEVLEFCRAIRKAGQDTATSMVVSYRNISMLASMDKVFNADLAVKLAITKGMEADDISTLASAIEVDAKNKFYKALKNMVK